MSDYLSPLIFNIEGNNDKKISKNKIATAVSLAILAAGASNAFAATTMYNTYNSFATATPTDGGAPNTNGFQANGTDGWVWGFKWSSNATPWTDPGTPPGQTALPPSFVGINGSVTPSSSTPFGYVGSAPVNWALEFTGATDSATISQAVLLKPLDPVALAGLGQCLCWQGNKNDGLVYLRRAGERLLRIAKKDTQIKPLVDLANQLLHWGDADGGATLAKEAVKLQPNVAPAQQTLAMCLNSLNHPAEALEVARKAHPS